MKLRIIQINIFLLMSINILAQDFSRHKWENRLVIVSAQDTNNSIFQSQIKELIENEKGLLERKVLVYQILPDKHKIGLNTKINWDKNNQHIAEVIPFQVSLIGLDGSVKLTQNEMLTSAKLFEVIDQMPMRRIEIEKNK